MLELLGAMMLGAVQPPESFRRLPTCRSDTSKITDPCVLTTRFSEQAVARLLAGRQQLHWLNGDRLTLIARFGPEGWGLLCCAIQTPLDAVGDTGIGAVTIRVPRVEEALLDAGMAGSETNYPAEMVATLHPPPAPPRVAALRGIITRHVFQSSNLGERREISVYVPPDLPQGARVPVIYLADGETERFAPIVEAAVRAGKAAPAMIVGLGAGTSEVPHCQGSCVRRSLEYLISMTPKEGEPNPLFDAHMRFVTDEVMPLVEREYPASRAGADHITAGYSNGGAWAFEAAELRPDRFGRVLAMSVAGGPWPTEHAATLKGARIFTGAGTFERFLLPRTRETAEAARHAGAAVEMREIVSGHSSLMWDILFAEGLAWLLPPPGHPR
jgi:enterochelin esterase-like enzyme